jgi:hypothetical protein
MLLPNQLEIGNRYYVPSYETKFAPLLVYQLAEMPTLTNPAILRHVVEGEVTKGLLIIQEDMLLKRGMILGSAKS